MRVFPTIPLVLLLIVQAVDMAAATPIYRCLGVDGIVRFQDQACALNERSRRIELPEEPASPAVQSSPEIIPVPSTRPSSERLREPAPAIDSELSATLCTREDGSRYLSESGRGERRAVPLGMLGIPRDSLADAYGGREGIGVSAPGLREPPSDHSHRGQLGALYTWIEDPCRTINRAQLCGFLDERIVDAERRLRLAFSDSRDQVRGELAGLRQRASACGR